jgi:hypothetical protein
MLTNTVLLVEETKKSHEGGRRRNNIRGRREDLSNPWRDDEDDQEGYIVFV